MSYRRRYIHGYDVYALSLIHISLRCAAIDPVLDEHKYIVPGLGDAGDLAFGEKLYGSNYKDSFTCVRLHTLKF